MDLNNKLDSFIDSFVVKMKSPVKSTSKSSVNNHIQTKSSESVTGKTKRKKRSLDEISSICSSDTNFGHKDDDELFFFDVSGNALTQSSVVHNNLKEPQFQHLDTVIDMIDSDVEMTYLSTKSTKKNNNNTSSKNGNSLSKQENTVLEKKLDKQKKKNFREASPDIFSSQNSENSVSRKRTPENSKNNKFIKESSAEIISSQRITSSQKSSSLGNLGSELKSQEKQKKNKHNKEFSIELLPSKKKQKNDSRVENLLTSPESSSLLISSERKKKRFREDITNNVDDSTNYSINLVTPKKKSKLSMEEFNSDLPNELDSQNNVTPKNKTHTKNGSKQDISEEFSNDLIMKNRLKVKKNFTELGARFSFVGTENKSDPTFNDILESIMIDRKSEMENKKKKRKDSDKIDTSVEGICIELLENNVESGYSGNDTNNNSNITLSGDNIEVSKKKKHKKLKDHAPPELDILTQNILSKSLDNNTQEKLVYKDSSEKKKVKKECDMTETSLGETSMEIIDNEDEFTVIKKKKSRKKYKSLDNLIDSIVHGNEQNTILERTPKEFIKNKKNKNSDYNSLQESSPEKGEYDDNLKSNKKKILQEISEDLYKGVDVVLTTNGFVEKKNKKKIQNDSLSELVTDITKNYNHTVDYVKPEKVKNKHLTGTSDKSCDGDISTKQENSISDLSLMETSSPERSTKKKKTKKLENHSLPEDIINKNKENKTQTQLSARENHGDMNRSVKQKDVSSSDFSFDVIEHPNENLVEFIKRKKKKKTKNKENDTEGIDDLQGIRGEGDTSDDLLKSSENLETLSSDLTDKDKSEFKIKKHKKNNGDNSKINNINNKIKETEDNKADGDNSSNKSSKTVTSNNDINRSAKQKDIISFSEISNDVIEHPNENLVEFIKRKKKKKEKTKNKKNVTQEIDDLQGIRGEDDISDDLLKPSENLELLSSDLTDKDKSEFKIKKHKKNNGDNIPNDKIKETEDNNSDRDNSFNKSSKTVTSNNDINRSAKQKDISSSDFSFDVIEHPNENMVELIKRKKKEKTKNKKNVAQEIDDLQGISREDDTSVDLLEPSENLKVLSSDLTEKNKSEFKIKKDKKNNCDNIPNDKIKETEDNKADRDNSSNKSSKIVSSNNDMNRSVKQKDISSSEILNDVIESPNENLVEFIKKKKNKNKENDTQEVDHLQGIKGEDDTPLHDLLKQSENLLADLFKSLDNTGDKSNNKVKNTNWSTQKNNSLDDSLSTVFDSIEDDQIKEHNASSDFEQSVTNQMLVNDELSTKSSISKLNMTEVYSDEDSELEQRKRRNKKKNIPIKIHKSLYGKIKKENDTSNSDDADHSTLNTTAGVDEELEPEELEALRNLSILLPFDEIPPLHRIKRASKATANEMQLAKQLGAKTGAFSKKEDELIIKNWEQLLKEHNMTIRPHAFFTFKNMGGTNEKVKFLQYISQGLDDRLPYRVHSRFKRLFRNKFKKQGRFSRQEDKEILDYMSTTKSSRPFLELEASMNRPNNAIQKRYELLISDKNKSHIMWDLEKSERMIKAMLELKKTERVKSLRNATFSEEEWQLLSSILDDIPSKKLQRAWKITIYPRLFMREDAYSIKRKIIDLLLEYGYTDVRTVNWEKIAGNFKGVTDRKVYDYFKVMLRTAPKDIQKDLKSSLEYLLVHFKGRYRRRLIRYKFKNGVLRAKLTSNY